MKVQLVELNFFASRQSDFQLLQSLEYIDVLQEFLNC